MKKLTYEKPELIHLNEVTYGRCHMGSHIAGPCANGSSPGGRRCHAGMSATNCITGSMAGRSSEFDFEAIGDEESDY